jgi:hypothetical protein
VATNGEVRVKFGQLTEPLRSIRAAKGTNLGQFLKRREMDYGASIRVNGEVANVETVLKDGDIITDIDNVNGGR